MQNTNTQRSMVISQLWFPSNRVKHRDSLAILLGKTTKSSFFHDVTQKVRSHVDGTAPFSPKQLRIMRSKHCKQNEHLRQALISAHEALKEKQREIEKLSYDAKSCFSGHDYEFQEKADIIADLEVRLASLRNTSEGILPPVQGQQGGQNQNPDGPIERSVSKWTQTSSSLTSEAAIFYISDGMSQEQSQDLACRVKLEIYQHLEEIRVLARTADSSWNEHSRFLDTIQQLEWEADYWKKIRSGGTHGGWDAIPSHLLTRSRVSSYLYDESLTKSSGIVKDIHITVLLATLDQLLQRAQRNRFDDLDAFKASMMMVIRCISKDMNDFNEITHDGKRFNWHELRATLVAAAELLLFACSSFFNAVGDLPLSFLDKTVSDFVKTLLDFLHIVKIRRTRVSYGYMVLAAN